MAAPRAIAIELSTAEAAESVFGSGDARWPGLNATRAKIVLLAAEGVSNLAHRGAARHHPA